ncbi:MAG: hypothetical protein EKK29_13435 [Hyphomicrobiales bacterium]|nr:MAG: hypothetical protein EKK29_13435 [Hyphomicrobiales bacterium]
MPALVAGIHGGAGQAWMAGTRPAMTRGEGRRPRGRKPSVLVEHVAVEVPVEARPPALQIVAIARRRVGAAIAGIGRDRLLDPDRRRDEPQALREGGGGGWDGEQQRERNRCGEPPVGFRAAGVHLSLRARQS